MNNIDTLVGTIVSIYLSNAHFLFRNLIYFVLIAPQPLLGCDTHMSLTLLPFRGRICSLPWVWQAYGYSTRDIIWLWMVPHIKQTCFLRMLALRIQSIVRKPKLAHIESHMNRTSIIISANNPGVVLDNIQNQPSDMSLGMPLENFSLQLLSRCTHQVFSWRPRLHMAQRKANPSVPCPTPNTESRRIIQWLPYDTSLGCYMAIVTGTLKIHKF